MSRPTAPMSMVPLDLLWLMLPGQRPWRELHWLSLMPGTRVTAVGDRQPPEAVRFLCRPYRQPTRRFVEAGALAWLQDLDSLPDGHDWVASLELCSLVTGQASALAGRRRQHQAVLVWANDPRSPLYRLPPYRQALRRARSADLYLCFVEAARDHCLALGLPGDRCQVVHPGVDTELFHPPAAPVAEPVAVFVSPLAANKGIDRLLDAFRLVRRSLPEAGLRVLGRGPLEGLVRKEAARPGSGVAYLGGGDRDRVAEVLRASAVFVTAPRPTRVWSEQFGLAYLEAMASALPVVTTACGSNHEAVRQPNLRVADDPEALAEALAAFLGDPARRARVGAENRRTVLEHHQLVGDEPAEHADRGEWGAGYGRDRSGRSQPVVDDRDRAGRHAQPDQLPPGRLGDGDVAGAPVQAGREPGLDPPAEPGLKGRQDHPPLLPVDVVDEHHQRSPAPQGGEERQAVLDIDHHVVPAQGAR